MQRTTIFRSSLAALLALALPSAYPAQAKPTTHTVKPGETLWTLARIYLGDGHRWRELYELNRDVVSEPRSLPAGAVLKLTVAEAQPPAPRQQPQVQAPAPAPAPTPAPALPVRRTAVDTPPGRPARIQVGQSPEAEEAGMELFRRRRVASSVQAFQTYREVKFHPLRAGEFYSGGFLTEGRDYPFGTLLGPVTPEQIVSGRARAAVQIHTQVGITPPEGGQYAAGDSLLVVDRREGPVGYGEIVVPTGLIRVTGQSGSQTVGMVVAVYGPIRDGQSVIPAEKFRDPGAVEYQQVSDGLQGRVLIARDLRELRLPQQVLFLDIGTQQGVRLGDLFEARRDPGPQPRAAAEAVDEVMATLQVVHVGERTATVKVRNVVSPDVPAGTRVRLVAKLPS